MEVEEEVKVGPTSLTWTERGRERDLTAEMRWSGEVREEKEERDDLRREGREWRVSLEACGSSWNC